MTGYDYRCEQEVRRELQQYEREKIAEKKLAILYDYRRRTGDQSPVLDEKIRSTESYLRSCDYHY